MARQASGRTRQMGPVLTRPGWSCVRSSIEAACWLVQLSSSHVSASTTTTTLPFTVLLSFTPQFYSTQLKRWTQLGTCASYLRNFLGNKTWFQNKNSHYQRWARSMRLLLLLSVAFSSDVELCIQAPHESQLARQFYVEFTLGNVVRSTNVAEEEMRRTCWDGNLSL